LFVVQQYFGVQIQGQSTTSLIIFSSVIWFGGAFISLWMSKRTAKKVYSLKMIDTTSSYQSKLWVVVDVVQSIANKHNITMPEIWVYNRPEINAFATWPSKNNSLVAVSQGLLDSMTEEEITWVVAHEMAHIINGDMVTMTLMQWVINTFVNVLARIVASLIDNAMRSDDDDKWWWLWTLGYFAISQILYTVFGFLWMFVLMAFSRHREYKADAWSARFVWKEYMIAALHKLENTAGVKTARTRADTRQDEFAMFKIFGGKSRLWLLASHPTLQQRIQKLETSHLQ